MRKYGDGVMSKNFVKNKVLVTNAELNNALAIVRSLGRKRIFVGSIGHTKTNPSFLSKYCKEKFISANPIENIEAFVDDLSRISKKNEYGVIIPVSTDSTISLSANIEKFENVKIPIADKNAILKAHNKEETLKIAKKIGVPIPETHIPKDVEELKDLSEKMEYPVVIKLRKSAASVGLQFAFSPDELLKKYNMSGEANAIIDYSKPLIQEYIPGYVHDVCVLFNKGEPRAALTQKRLWIYPTTGGWGVVNETTHEPELIELTFKLLKKLKWHGVAQVEFKIDNRDKKPKLMEINPKFWGTLELSIKAGIDFPYLLYKMAIEDDIEEKYDYKTNLKFIRTGYGLFGNILEKKIFMPLKELYSFHKEGAENDIYMDDLLPNILSNSVGLVKALRDFIS